MSWNVRGWTQNNEIIRKIFIEELQPDILCVSETHLKGNDTILIDNYKLCLHNRTVSHVKAPIMFGGVGTFVKENLFNLFDVSVMDESFEGIQGLLFSDKNSGIKFLFGSICVTFIILMETYTIVLKPYIDTH